MANHKSAQKRIRTNGNKRTINRYQAKTVRTAIKNFRLAKTKNEASKAFPKIASMVDKLAKKNIIHKNKAANMKSKLAKHVSKLK